MLTLGAQFGLNLREGISVNASPADLNHPDRRADLLHARAVDHALGDTKLLLIGAVIALFNAVYFNTVND